MIDHTVRVRFIWRNVLETMASECVCECKDECLPGVARYVRGRESMCSRGKRALSRINLVVRGSTVGCESRCTRSKGRMDSSWIEASRISVRCTLSTEVRQTERKCLAVEATEGNSRSPYGSCWSSIHRGRHIQSVIRKNSH